MTDKNSASNKSAFLKKQDSLQLRAERNKKAQKTAEKAIKKWIMELYSQLEEVSKEIFLDGEKPFYVFRSDLQLEETGEELETLCSIDLATTQGKITLKPGEVATWSELMELWVNLRDAFSAFYRTEVASTLAIATEEKILATYFPYHCPECERSIVSLGQTTTENTEDPFQALLLNETEDLEELVGLLQSYYITYEVQDPDA